MEIARRGVRRLAIVRCAVAGAALLVALQPGAGAAPPPNVGNIVPGQGIGPIRIGMTNPQVRVLTGSLPCEIAVAYTDGRASRLETNCGVAYQTAEGITVGLDGSRIWWIHGEPDLTVASNFARTRADWLVYRGAGIGFRVIYAEGGTLIQAISIFRGTGAPAVTRPPVIPPAAPPPVLGE
ncbi:MAG: hypothetical protein ACRDGN_05980 [bacterium]